MKALLRVTLALAAAAVVCPAVAADKTPGTQRPSMVAAIMSQRAALSTQQTAGTDAVASTGSGPRIANPVRAYPPSCLAYPLPDTPPSDATTFQMGLYTRDANGNSQTPEVVNVYLWYLPCSSSGNTRPYNADGLPNGALLMRIARSASLEGDTSIFPTFPLLSSTQSGNTNAVRGAVEPDTFTADGPFDAPIYNSTTYVLENYQNTAQSGFTYFNNSFSLIIDPVIGGIGTAAVTVPIGGYTGSGLSSIPIDGFLSSAYYDPNHSGEGLFVEIYDNGDHLTRTVFASWYTYDTLGIPFWLIAQGTVSYGATSLTNATVYYFTNGGFAGDFGASATSNTWGTMSMSWPDCDTLTLNYTGGTDPSIITGGPSGSGTLTWTRLSDINGLACE